MIKPLQKKDMDFEHHSGSVELIVDNYENMEKTLHEKLTNFSLNGSEDLETSLSLAAEAGNLLLCENNKLKQEIHDKKLEFVNLQLETEDKLNIAKKEMDTLSLQLYELTKENNMEKSQLIMRFQEKTQLLEDIEEQEYKEKCFYDKKIKNLEDNLSKIKFKYEENDKKMQETLKLTVEKLNSEIKALKETLKIYKSKNGEMLKLQTEIKRLHNVNVGLMEKMDSLKVRKDSKSVLEVNDLNTNTRLAITSELLSQNCLTDFTLQPYFELLNEHCLENTSSIVVNPLIVHALQISKEYVPMIDPLLLKTKENIILPINNSDKPEVADSGSHWSTLVYQRTANKYYYFDSYRNLNLSSANKVANNLSMYLGDAALTADFSILNGPQQQNGYDCGIFTCWTIESIIHGILKTGSPNFDFIQTVVLDLPQIIVKRSLLSYVLMNSSQLDGERFFKLMVEKPNKERERQTRDQTYKGVYTYQEGKNDSEKIQSSDLFQCKVVHDGNKQKDAWLTVKSCNKNGKNTSHNKKKENNRLISMTGLDTNNKYKVLADVQETEQSSGTTLASTPTQSNNNRAMKTARIKHKNEKLGSVGTKLLELPETRMIICSDSQGSNIANKVEVFSHGKINAFGYSRANTTLMQVIESASLDNENPVILLGGTNDSLSDNMQEIYESVENKLITISQNRPVFITTIPIRHDKPFNHPTNQDIQLANNYISEITARNGNVHLLNLNGFRRSDYTRHGLHLNNKGKTKLAHKIIKSISWWHSWTRTYGISQNNIETSLKPEEELSFPVSEGEKVCSGSCIQVIVENMATVIKKFENDKSTAFAHCISSDFGEPRQMSAGVAVAFRNRFGKPLPSQCPSTHLACQTIEDGATIYSLITKQKYNWKPSKDDYDLAFKQLKLNFQNKKLKRLICSPLGCVRDNISLYHFISNVKDFCNATGALVQIVTYKEESSRTLRNGLNFEEFIHKMRQMINKETMQTSKSPKTPITNDRITLIGQHKQNCSNNLSSVNEDRSPNPAQTQLCEQPKSPQFNHQTMQPGLHYTTGPEVMSSQEAMRDKRSNINLDTEQSAVERAPASFVTLYGEQLRPQNRTGDVFVVPGDLTFSEALKQSNSGFGELLISHSQAVPASIVGGSLVVTAEKTAILLCPGV
ncbi:SUMO1 sentrin specific peptidase 8 [Homalodisca vitripennis]|nr:SUMO1 sentrin specific peptidase 8 [Homalodisca vitripennis]